MVSLLDLLSIAFKYTHSFTIHMVFYLKRSFKKMIPSKVTLKSPEGGDYKNQKDKEKVHLFRKNEDIIVGFVFVSDSKKDNTLLWNDAFSESVPEKTDNITIELKMDLIKTKDKN